MVTVGKWRDGDCTIYIGRPGKGLAGPYGNPFLVGQHGNRGECVLKFREWFYGDSPAAQKMRERARSEIGPYDRLGCFCAPAACHGDVIAEYVNSGYKMPG